MKKISIIIPTLNSSKTIRKSINSVLSQNFKNFEIIVVDSYSIDKTFENIRSFNLKNKVKFFRFPKNRTLADARYFGIKKATGSIIAFLDSDDYWDRRKLYLQYLKLQRNKFCCTGFVYIKNFKKYSISNFPKKILLKNLIVSRPVANSSVVCYRSLLMKIPKKYFSEYAEDYLWWIMILKRINYLYFYNVNLTYLTISQDNRSKNLLKNLKSLFLIYKNVLQFSLFKIIIIFTKLGINNFKKKYFLIRK